MHSALIHAETGGERRLALSQPLSSVPNHVGGQHGAEYALRILRVNTKRLATPEQRLRWAREQAGYAEASDAAEALGIAPPTYYAHENGSRGLARSAKRYADFFHVSLDWLLAGRGEPRRKMSRENLVDSYDPDASDDVASTPMVPVLGYVGAGSEAHFYASAQGPIDEVEAPRLATDKTAALEIRGVSLGPLFDRWLVFYDDVRRPLTADLIGKLCVVGLSDGRVLVKKVVRAKDRRLFNLVSQYQDDPIENVSIDWAAKVTGIYPR